MQAVLCRQLGSYEDLTLETVDDPVPGKGEVLIDVAAAGVNFPDLLMVRGHYQMRPTLPFVPGGECAGTVAAVGEGVTRFAAGDRVFAMGMTGAFAEKMTVAEASVQPVPEGLGLAAAAGVAFTYGTSYYALAQRARLRSGETLLVLGAAGGVGTAAVALGKVMGARVIAAASSEEKLDTATAAGADLCINYTDEPLKDRVKELTGGRGADVVYDPVGGETSEQALRAIAWDGRYLVIGFAAGEIPAIPLNLVLLKSAQIVGVFWGAWLQRDPAASQRNFDELGAMFADGRLKPQVTPLPLAEFHDALRTIAERRVLGKLVLTMPSATG
jgi:NADPH:quinone reductase